MRCPNCDATLTTITYEGIEIETCQSCKGEWLDADELGKVVSAREVRFNPEERVAVAAATKITGVKLDVADRDLVCPKCGGQTDAVNYGGDTGIVIDNCTGCHGIWLDAGELEKVQMVVEGWEDGLPDDLKRHSSRLRQVADEVDEKTSFKASRFAFLNSIINGILDVVT